jgi:demethylmenaquinone methyltransferase/2-methoxy-6-polyprenyl-1,4-benzoquinol methylase
MASDLTLRYEAAAPSWGRRLAWLGFPAAYRAIVDDARGLLPPTGPIRAIDLGAGDGAFAEALLAKLGSRLRLTLLDPSPAMLRAAENRLGPGRAAWVTGDLQSSTLPQAWFDLVTAAHLLEHLPDPVAALAQIARLLRPGGTLILVVSRPHWCSRLVWLTWRHRRYREAEILRLLGGAGLVKARAWHPPAGPPRRLSLAYAAQRPL